MAISSSPRGGEECIHLKKKILNGQAEHVPLSEYIFCLGLMKESNKEYFYIHSNDKRVNQRGYEPELSNGSGKYGQIDLCI